MKSLIFIYKTALAVCVIFMWGLTFHTLLYAVNGISYSALTHVSTSWSNFILLFLLSTMGSYALYLSDIHIKGDK